MMDNPLILAPITAGLAFLTVGLAFAAVKRRQTGLSYILFWRNPLNPEAQAFTRNMFFQGETAEIGRVLLFAAATLLFAAQLFGIN